MKGDFYTGLIRLYLLHHAAKEGSVFGLGMIEELGEHGYRLSPGTLYPILHRLEDAGYLKSHREPVGERFVVVMPSRRRAAGNWKKAVIGFASCLANYLRMRTMRTK